MREAEATRHELSWQSGSSYRSRNPMHIDGARRAQSTLAKDTLPASYVAVMDKIDRVGWNNMQWAKGFTLLHWAAKKGNVELVRRFIGQRADPQHRDDTG